jgi:hypothetical protein
VIGAQDELLHFQAWLTLAPVLARSSLRSSLAIVFGVIGTR